MPVRDVSALPPWSKVSPLVATERRAASPRGIWQRSVTSERVSSTRARAVPAPCRRSLPGAWLAGNEAR